MTTCTMNNINGQDEPTNDGQKLKLIYIPPQPSWTGMKVEVPNAQPNGLALEGLLLWNVMGFALEDEKDYAKFSIINKEWNQMVKTVVPPIMFQMMAALARNKNYLTLSDLTLMDTVFESLESPTCTLYRQERKYDDYCGEDYGDDDDGTTWPHLQPHFSLVLMQFAYEVCTQRSPNNLTEELHEMVCTFLKKHAEKTAQQIIQSLDRFESEGATPLRKTLEQFFRYWIAWDGIVQTVRGIASYLECNYIKHHNFKRLVEQAQFCLVTEVLKSGKNYKMEKLLHCVHQNMRVLPISILLQVHQVGSSLSSFYPSVKELWENIAALQGVQKVYSEIDAAITQNNLFASKVGQQNTNRSATKITVTFPNGTAIGLPEHFVVSSEVLKNLHLHHGETIRWYKDDHIGAFQMALMFYELDEHTPMPSIDPSIHWSTTANIVGEQYAQIVRSLDHSKLFERIAFANFMSLQKLLDLCILEATNLIKGKSEAELQRIFNIHG